MRFTQLFPGAARDASTAVAANGNGTAHANGNGTSAVHGTNGHASHPPAVAEPAAPQWPASFASILAPLPESPAPDATTALGDDAESAGTGIHAITRKTDYWFEREAHVIETHAEQWAAGWAEKGLPRHDVARTEPLEPEQVLGGLSAQLFRDWQRRVRTKLQDATEEGSQQAAAGVAALRSALSRLQAVASEGADTQAKIDRLREEAERDAHPVRYEAFIKPWVFWLTAVVLVLVEFFANFPVFRLLLPMSTALAKAARTAADNIDDTSIFAGPSLLLHEMLMHVEAVVVAFVVVVVLVFLGKSLGGALRPLFALSEKEHPLAAHTIRAHRRQQWIPVAVSAIGLVAVLSFLYYSRGDIAATAGARVTADSTALQAALREQAAAVGPAEIARTTLLVASRQETLQQHQDDAAYAATVQRNNTPILALNIALLCAAIVLGFGVKKENLDDRRGEHPEIPRLRDRLGELELEKLDLARQAKEAQTHAEAGIARVMHLGQVDPVQGWESKALRLQSIIPRFRGENARLRGLDPANIRAFDSAPQLDLPVDERRGLEAPPAFAGIQQEFVELVTLFARLAPRTPSSSPAVAQQQRAA